MYNGRSTHIDIAKFIGMVTIVIGHDVLLQQSKSSFLYYAVFSFHIPLFFFLGGLFISTRKRFSRQFFSKLDSLLKPYFVISFVLAVKTGIEGELNVEYIVGIFYGNGITIDWIPMWFLTHFFVASLVAYLLLSLFFSCIQSAAVKMFLCLATLYLASVYIKAFWLGDSLFFKSAALPGLPFSVDLLGVTVPYMLLGRVLRDAVLSMKVRHVPGLLSIIFFIVLNSYTKETLDLNLRRYDDFFLVNIKIVVSIYMVLYLASLLSTLKGVDRCLAYCGQASIFILIFHFFIQAVSYKFFTLVWHDSIMANVLAVVCGVMVPVTLFWLVTLNRFASAMLLPVTSRKFR